MFKNKLSGYPDFVRKQKKIKKVKILNLYAGIDKLAGEKLK